MRKRTILIILMVLTVCLMPLSCCGISAVALSMLWPGFLAFDTEFEVVNRSGQTIFVSAVGTVGKEGKKTALWLLERPPRPACDLRLAEGESVAIRYDWDDVNFSEIVVRTESGQYYQMVVDPKPAESRYHPPLSQHYVIGSLSELKPVDEHVLHAALHPGSARTWLVLMACLCPPLLLALWIRLYRKETRKRKPPLPEGDLA